jgi:hypothetical protein
VLQITSKLGLAYLKIWRWLNIGISVLPVSTVSYGDISCVALEYPADAFDLAASGSEQAKKRIENLAKRKRPAGRPSRQEAKAEGCVIA